MNTDSSLDADVADLIKDACVVGEVRGLIERFTEDEAALERALPPRFDSARDVRQGHFYHEWQSVVVDVPPDGLTRAGQVDRALLVGLLRGRVRGLEIDRARRAETAFLTPFAPLICAFDAERREMHRTDPRQAAHDLDRIRGCAEAGCAAWDAGETASALTAGRAARAVAEMQASLAIWFQFYDGYDPAFSWWTREPYKAADAALTRWGDVLKKAAGGESAEDPDALIGNPIGQDALQAELDRELIPYTPDELIAIGDREFRWCEAEMRRASAEMGFGDDWKAALEAVKTRHVAPGEQPGLVRKLAQEAIDYVETHDLVTVPPLAREIWRMEMMAPERQKVSPFFLGGETIIVSFPTDGMSHEAKQMSLRGNNRHFARATVQHELIPGHHLQMFMARRHRPYRAIFETPFYVEGWALHWEMLLWERGFAQSPEDRVGMLFWRMHRCARITFSLRYHLGETTPDDCVNLLVDRVGHERANAVAEVRRSIGDEYPPLYQAAYMLGGLQMRALYREHVEAGTMTPRAFHDWILKQNAISPSLLRADLSGEPIPTDPGPDWRFDAGFAA